MFKIYLTISFLWISQMASANPFLGMAFGLETILAAFMRPGAELNAETFTRLNRYFVSRETRGRLSDLVQFILEGSDLEATIGYNRIPDEERTYFVENDETELSDEVVLSTRSVRRSAGTPVSYVVNRDEYDLLRQFYPHIFIDSSNINLSATAFYFLINKLRDNNQVIEDLVNRLTQERRAKLLKELEENGLADLVSILENADIMRRSSTSISLKAEQDLTVSERQLKRHGFTPKAGRYKAVFIDTPIKQKMKIGAEISLSSSKKSGDDKKNVVTPIVIDSQFSDFDDGIYTSVYPCAPESSLTLDASNPEINILAEEFIQTYYFGETEINLKNIKKLRGFLHRFTRFVHKNIERLDKLSFRTQKLLNGEDHDTWCTHYSLYSAILFSRVMKLLEIGNVKIHVAGTAVFDSKLRESTGHAWNVLSYTTSSGVEHFFFLDVLHQVFSYLKSGTKLSQLEIYSLSGSDFDIDLGKSILNELDTCYLYIEASVEKYLESVKKSSLYHSSNAGALDKFAYLGVSKEASSLVEKKWVIHDEVRIEKTKEDDADNIDG